MNICSNKTTRYQYRQCLNVSFMLIRFLLCLLMQLKVLLGHIPLRNLNTLLFESKVMMDIKVEKAASISRSSDWLRLCLSQPIGKLGLF